MHAEDAGPARLFRRDDAGRWVPFGPVLPPVEDDEMHAALDEHRTVYWHLPTTVEVRSGDRLVSRERAWVMLDRCGPEHPAVVRLVDYMQANYVDVDGWLTSRQVWSCRPARMS